MLKLLLLLLLLTPVDTVASNATFATATVIGAIADISFAAAVVAATADLVAAAASPRGTSTVYLWRHVCDWLCSAAGAIGVVATAEAIAA